MIQNTMRQTAWEGLYFGGVAFKYQEQPNNLAVAIENAKEYLDVITTSGPGTGKSIDLDKIKRIRTLS